MEQKITKNKFVELTNIYKRFYSNLNIDRNHNSYYYRWGLLFIFIKEKIRKTRICLSFLGFLE